MEGSSITQTIIGAAIQVHTELGPSRGLDALRQVQLPVTYKGVHLHCGYRIDLLVEHTVVVDYAVQV